MSKLVKIILTGPESVGKSTLVKQLANYFNTSYRSELARDFVENLNRNYTQDDVLQIARLQINQEILSEKENNIVFFDTDLIITKVWLKKVYGTVPKWIDEHLQNHLSSLHLLCYPDLPWQDDPVRENPDNREVLFLEYQTEIEKLGISYFIVKGTGNERVENAINFINEFLRK